MGGRSLIERKNLTAAELIHALSQIDPETRVRNIESDSERCRWYEWGISGVNSEGILQYGYILDSGDDWGYDDED